MESKIIEEMEAPWGGSFKNVLVTFDQFEFDGSTAISMYADNGELLSTPVVNLSEYGVKPPTPQHVFIKDYSEGEGMTDLLVKHNIVERTGTVIEFGPFDAKAELVRIK